jgi:hypothetical protein
MVHCGLFAFGRIGLGKIDRYKKTHQFGKAGWTAAIRSTTITSSTPENINPIPTEMGHIPCCIHRDARNCVCASPPIRLPRSIAGCYLQVKKLESCGDVRGCVSGGLKGGLETAKKKG